MTQAAEIQSTLDKGFVIIYVQFKASVFRCNASNLSERAMRIEHQNQVDFIRVVIGVCMICLKQTNQ